MKPLRVTFGTRTAEGCVPHLCSGSMRYPVALAYIAGPASIPERTKLGHLLYATPGGGRKTALEIAADTPSEKGNA